jgi:hypothetical protein
VLKRAGEMVRTLVAVGAGRAAGEPEGRKGAKTVSLMEDISEAATVGTIEAAEEPSREPTGIPPYRPSA